MNGYLTVRCRLPVELEGLVSQLLNQYQVLGCQVVDSGPGEAEFTVYLNRALAAEADRLEVVLAGLGAAVVDVGTAEAGDWLGAYRRQARPFPVGARWWIEPRPESRTPAPNGRIRLIVEPTTAFGSGSHETTQLVLLQLERIPVAGESVLDVGTGCGILALAAQALGAWPVVGCDTDPHAAFAARRTATRQGWPQSPMFTIGSISCIDRTSFRLIMCNIVSSDLEPLLPDIARLLEPAAGEAILSGILSTERTAVRDRVERVGLTVVDELGLQEWISVRVCRD